MTEPHDDLVTARAACEIIGGKNSPIHVATLYRGIAAGRYPSPIAVGAQARRWSKSELLAFIRTAANARQGSAA